MDTVSQKKRSEIMKAVKSRDSKIEIDFRKKIWNAGFYYRKNSPKYRGKPDLVFKRFKLVIFVDSCFWHGCEKHGSIPETHNDFWREKLGRNRRRDKEVNKHYKKIGWRILRFWEHDLKNNSDKCLKVAISAIELSRANKK